MSRRFTHGVTFGTDRGGRCGDCEELWRNKAGLTDRDVCFPLLSPACVKPYIRLPYFCLTLATLHSVEPSLRHELRIVVISIVKCGCFI